MMTFWSLLLRAGTLLFMLSGTALRAESPATPPARFEIYGIGTMDLDTAMEAVKAFVGTEGQITPDRVNQRLLVVTTPDRHAQIADMMKQLAVPARNVRIEVFFDGQSSNDEFEASLGASGEVTHGPAGLGGTITVKPKIISQSTTRTSSDRQILLVGSGREGFLRIGESVPYLQWLVSYAWPGGIGAPQLAWQEVGSFLVVQPTIVGDGPLVRVKLIPELRGLVNGRPEHARFASVSTEVVVQDGQSIDLGGLGQHAEFFNRFLVGVSKGGESRTLNIRLVPHIQPLLTP